MFTASRTPLALLALCALATAPAAQHIITDGAQISDTDPATADRRNILATLENIERVMRCAARPAARCFMMKP